jgi:hypothetical protein
MADLNEHSVGPSTPDDPYHDLRTIRFLSFVLIALGVLGWGFIALFIAGYRGGQPLELSEILILCSPLLYFIAYFCCCFSFVGGRTRVALCLIFNAPLSLLILYYLAHLIFAGVVLSIFPVGWVLLCSEQHRLGRGAGDAGR